MMQASKSPAGRDLDLSVSMRDPSIPLPAAKEMIFRQLRPPRYIKYRSRQLILIFADLDISSIHSSLLDMLAAIQKRVSTTTNSILKVSIAESDGLH
jgi:hypothetical protein